MVIKSAEFVTSVADPQKLLQFDKPEFAFVGRSNVGKSSLINALVNQKKLAKASSTPGRTRLINIFEINKSFYFIDLPGYGFAEASKKEQASWQGLIGSYFENSHNIKRVFVLVDIRHEPSEKDKLMLEYLYAYNLPFNIIATKADKISRGQILKHKNMLASALGVGIDDIIVTSSIDKSGRDRIYEIIESLI